MQPCSRQYRGAGGRPLSKPSDRDPVAMLMLVAGYAAIMSLIIFIAFSSYVW
jgi:hypothetical protein